MSVSSQRQQTMTEASPRYHPNLLAVRHAQEFALQALRGVQPNLTGRGFDLNLAHQLPNLGAPERRFASRASCLD